MIDIKSDKFALTVNNLSLNEIKEIQPSDLHIFDNVHTNLIDEIFYHFLSTRIELAGINDFFFDRDPQNPNQKQIIIELNNYSILHPTDNIFTVKIANNNTLEFFSKTKNSEIPIKLKTDISKPFLQIKEFITLVLQKISSEYTQSDDKYIKDYEREIKKHVISEIPVHITASVPLSIEVTKRNFWCNPPLLKIILGNYLFECGYENFDIDFSKEKDSILTSCEKYILNERTTGNYEKQKNNRL